MKKRSAFILIGLFIIQALITYLVYRTGEGSAPPERQFFPGMLQEEVQRLVISDPESTVALRKGADGWFIDAVAAYPADEEKIMVFLDKVKELRSSHLVGRTKSSHARFHLTGQKHDRRIDLELKDEKIITFFMGSAPTYRTTHVRMAEDDAVYLVKNFSAWEAPLDESAWWQTAFVTVNEQDVDEVFLENSHGGFRLVRSGEVWRMGDANEEKAEVVALDETAVQEFIEKTLDISLSSYLGRELLPEYGLEQPSARLILKSADRNVMVAVGNKLDDSGEYAVKSSESPFVVQIAPYMIEALLEQKKETLFQKQDSTEEAALKSGSHPEKTN